MYLTTKRRISKSKIFDNLAAYILKLDNGNIAKKLEPIVPENPIWIQIVEEVYNLNEALFNRKSVFAVCVKEPPHIDKGRHYFDVYYVKDNKIRKFYTGEAMQAFGAERNKRYKHLSPWIFSSGVIGMNRVLDATNILFYVLKTTGGCYAQISCIN